MVNILITSGGTEEYIDDVRVITNISTGKLGKRIAESFSELEGIKIYYVHSRTAAIPEGENIHLFKVRTANDALNMIESIMLNDRIDVVIHAMAVSDFTFKRDSNVKLKSNDANGFIEYLRSTITYNPKIISKIKEWNSKTILIGFKFEVGLTTDNLIACAESLIEKNNCDLVIANDKVEMQQQSTHVAHFVYSKIMQTIGFKNAQYHGKDNISKQLVLFVAKNFATELDYEKLKKFIFSD